MRRGRKKETRREMGEENARRWTERRKRERRRGKEKEEKKIAKEK